MNAWSHLPNAKHIDLVIASIKAYPEKWDDVWHSIRETPWICSKWDITDRSVWIVVRGSARATECNKAWSEVWGIRRYESWSAATGAISALVAYDDCAHLLSSNPKEVELLAKLGSTPAILLFPACIVFNETNIKS